jgi:hypothetical protein
MHDHSHHDLNEVLRRMCPQGFALLRFEHGTEMLRMGARELMGNARLAVEALGPRGAKAFGRALLAVGQQHVAVAERMIELAEEANRESVRQDVNPAAASASDPPKARSGVSHATEADQ